MANIDVTQIPNKAVKFCASKTRAEAAADAQNDANKGTIYFCTDGGIVLNGGVYAEANTIEKIKINGVDLTIQQEVGQADTPFVNIPVVTGDSAGEIKVNNQAIAVNGFTALSESHSSLAQTVQSIQEAINADDGTIRKYTLTPENLAKIKSMWTDAESDDAIAIVVNKSIYVVINADSEFIYTYTVSDRRNTGDAILEYRKFRIADATGEGIETLRITGESGISARIDAKADTSAVETLESSVVKKTGTTGNVILPETSYIGSVSNSSPNNKIATMADVTGSIAGLTGAMHFKGVKDSLPVDLQNYEAGDVIIVGTKEYILSGDGSEGSPKQWVELGDEGIYLTKSTAYSHSDNDKGVAVTLGGTAESPTIDVAVSLGSVTTDNGSVVSGGQVKTAIDDAISVAVNNLDGDITGSPGQAKTLTAFSQTNGKVTASFGNIGIAHSQVTDWDTELAKKADATRVTSLETNTGAITRTGGGGQESTTTILEEGGDSAIDLIRKNDLSEVTGSIHIGNGIFLSGGYEYNDITTDSEIKISGKAVKSSIEALESRAGTIESSVSGLQSTITTQLTWL